MNINLQLYFVIFVCLSLIDDDVVDATDFYFKYFPYRKKQKHAKMYNGIEKSCEMESCLGLVGLQQIKCARKCVSQSCYNQLYAWDELEEGEIDVRLNSFKGCVASELQNNELNRKMQ